LVAVNGQTADVHHLPLRLSGAALAYLAGVAGEFLGAHRRSYFEMQQPISYAPGPCPAVARGR
jgi:hypothetical protein